ncbi:hypothetical protein WBP06_27415 [Novosphingobium sp. BL-8H]|uniref:hypothetical protein n=1 Tax=Novosphingobium sp. BL-8H TaxID=3127640 RepID=UPI003757B4C8
MAIKRRACPSGKHRGHEVVTIAQVAAVAIDYGGRARTQCESVGIDGSARHSPPNNKAIGSWEEK